MCKSCYKTFKYKILKMCNICPQLNYIHFKYYIFTCFYNITHTYVYNKLKNSNFIYVRPVIAAEFTEGYEFQEIVLSLVFTPWTWHCQAETCRSKLAIMSYVLYVHLFDTLNKNINSVLYSMSDRYQSMATLYVLHVYALHMHPWVKECVRPSS